MLLLELDGEGSELERNMETCGEAMFEAGAVEVLVAQHGGERERLWAARRELSHSLRRAATHKLSEDVVVPRSQIANLLDRCRALAHEEEIQMPTYGHAGDGNLHVNFLWNEPGERSRVDRAIRTLFENVVSLRGTLSGEHGIGTLKAPYLDIEQSPQLIALQRRIKGLFDPQNILNPGKIFTPGGQARHGAC
jgi:glycolate oxidase